MPQISKQKTDKIQEQVLYYMYQTFPKQLFTSDIAQELARDEEFIKKILLIMLKKELVVKIDKNPSGLQYKKRLRWRISNKAYDIYKQINQKSSDVASKNIDAGRNTKQQSQINAELEKEYNNPE